ncbi:hypothetical protein WJX74_010131 [Apatococcus lobatus]|uniref:Translocator protein n=1 Tax=Apatococcus lobatus TaxID=904363 RepID=A0AAW1S459_9CHLO
MGTVLSVAVAVGVPIIAGSLIGLGLQDDVKGWYKSLRKPKWCPPSWVFGPMWAALYGMMGYASYLVWQNGAPHLPLTLYGIQLVMNLAWSPIFFKAKEIGYSLLDQVALLGVLSATIIEFNKVSPEATYLMLPYLGWTVFATVLTVDIYRKNPGNRGNEPDQQARDAAYQAKDAVQDAANKVQNKASELFNSSNSSDAADDAKSGLSKAGDKVKEGADKAGNKAQQGYDQAKEGAGKAGDKAKEGADKAGNKAEQGYDQAKGQANKAGDQAKEGADKAGNKAEHGYDQAKGQANKAGDQAKDGADRARSEANKASR